MISRLAGQLPLLRVSGACKDAGFRDTLSTPPQKRVSDLLFEIRRLFPQFFFFFSPAITVILFITIVLFCENPNNQ